MPVEVGGELEEVRAVDEGEAVGVLGEIGGGGGLLAGAVEDEVEGRGGLSGGRGRRLGWRRRRRCGSARK